LVLGAIVFVSWIIGELRHLDLSPERNAVVVVYGLVCDIDKTGHRHLSVEKLSLIFTAIATIILAKATMQLHRATNRLVAADAPVLEINLYPPSEDAPQVEGATVASYPEALQAEDGEHFSGASLRPPRFIYLEIRNDQNEPFSAARDVEVKVELRSEDLPATVADLSPVLREMQGELRMGVQKALQRTIATPVLGPGCAQLHPIFNAAPLGELKAAIVSVKYYDLRGKRARSAAIGQVVLTRDKDGSVATEGGYSEPAKWEMP